MADHARALVGACLLAGVLVTAAPAPPAPVARTESAYAVDDVTPVLHTDGNRRVALDEGIEPFTMIGVTHRGGGEGRVRAHLPTGWTGWLDLHAGHGGGPTSDPVWVGEGADGYELRLPPAATGVVVHLVRATGDAIELAPVAERAATEAGNPAPPVRRRSTWGARPYQGTIRLNPRITRGVVHHTVNSNSYGQDQVPSMLRSIQAYHQDTRGWPDIAYNFVVDRWGRIWEARARSYDAPVVVSASSGTTRETVTVAFLGDGSTRAAPSEAVRAMGRLLGWKLRKHGLLPTRANVVGHRQIGQTSCPGAAIMGQIRTIETVAIAGNPPAGPYDDVPWTSPNAGAIDWAGEEGIIPGYPDRTFRPHADASRAAALVWLWRLAGEPSGTSHPFTDVPAGALYQEALEWGSGEGIVRGISPTRFAPGRDMSRQAFVDLLWRWVGEPQIPVAHPFTDAGPRPSLDWAAEGGLAGGTTFRPTAVLSRSNAAVFLHHLRPFTDVGRHHVARAAVDWAWGHLIVAGFGGHAFRPDVDVTRAQGSSWIWRFLDRPVAGPVDPAPAGDPLDRATAATWLWQAAGAPTVALPAGFTDVAAGAPYEMAAAWAEDFTIFADLAGSTFGPDDLLSRADLVRALYRLADRPGAWAVTPPTTVRF